MLMVVCRSFTTQSSHDLEQVGHIGLHCITHRLGAGWRSKEKNVFLDLHPALTVIMGKDKWIDQNYIFIAVNVE